MRSRLAFDRTGIGRSFFAIGLIALGIEHFFFGDFITGRAPAWPESLPGRLVWAWLSGITFIVSGGAILLGKRARAAALLTAVLIASWALLRHIPILAAESFLSGAWTRAGKALTFTGGAMAIAATFPRMRAPLLNFMNLRSELIVVGRGALGLFLVIAGIQHFLFTKFVVSLIPTWFPGNAVFWTYFAAVALISGGIGLFIPRTARLAALLSGLMVFSWFWIVHIPRSLDGVSDSIAVFEALAVSGIALALSGSPRLPLTNTSS